MKLIYYVGLISDVALTLQSGLLGKLEGMMSISIMADRGFTIYEHLTGIEVKLNIPPFMEGRRQLPEAEVCKGRKIASLRRGRIKQFGIANQIVCVLIW